MINGILYKYEDIAELPSELAAYKAAEKDNDMHIAFAGELSLYSNFHHSPFTVNGETLHSAEQWVQYQKALMFGDSHIANKILQSKTPLECKKLSYQINGVDNNKWHNEGYEICLDDIWEKFIQNPTLLSMLHTTKPKILVEATNNRLWGTGIPLCNNDALNTEKWRSTGWLSRMLLSIRDDS